MKQWLALVAVVLSIVLGIQMFTAEGAPSQPNVTLSTALTGASQSVSFTFDVAVMGASPVNSIDEQGAKVLFSVFQNGHPVVTNQTLAVGPVSGQGFSYVLQGQATVGLPSVGCTAGSFCVENVSVAAQSVVPAWTGVYSSPWVNVTFSTSAVYTTSQPGLTAPGDQFAWNFYGAFTVLVAVDAWISYALFRHPGVMVLAVTATALSLGEYAVWMLLLGIGH